MGESYQFVREPVNNEPGDAAIAGTFRRSVRISSAVYAGGV
jgi:hypothetical protein